MRCPPRKVACIEQMWPKKEAFFSHRKRDLCCPVVYIRVPRMLMKMKELLFSLIVWSCLDMFCYDCTRLLNVIYLYIFRSMKLYFTSSQSACCLQSFVIFFTYITNVITFLRLLYIKCIYNPPPLFFLWQWSPNQPPTFFLLLTLLFPYTKASTLFRTQVEV